MSADLVRFRCLQQAFPANDNLVWEPSVHTTWLGQRSEVDHTPLYGTNFCRHRPKLLISADAAPASLKLLSWAEIGSNWPILGKLRPNSAEFGPTSVSESRDSTLCAMSAADSVGVGRIRPRFGRGRTPELPHLGPSSALFRPMLDMTWPISTGFGPESTSSGRLCARHSGDFGQTWATSLQQIGLPPGMSSCAKWCSGRAPRTSCCGACHSLRARGGTSGTCRRW